MSGQLAFTKSFICSSLGDNTILNPRNGKLKLFSVIIEPNADITGEVQIKIGSTIISGSRNPKTGAMYGFNHNPNFIEGGLGQPLIINLPSATAVTVNVTWREVPDFSSGY